MHRRCNLLFIIWRCAEQQPVVFAFRLGGAWPTRPCHSAAPISHSLKQLFRANLDLLILEMSGSLARPSKARPLARRLRNSMHTYSLSGASLAPSRPEAGKASLNSKGLWKLILYKKQLWRSILNYSSHCILIRIAKAKSSLDCSQCKIMSGKSSCLCSTSLFME